VRLLEFRVQNFRSINDSGTIKISKLTTLVGRNESGKSNLLLGLLSLNPPDGIEPLSAIKNFPRDRRLSECTDTTMVVQTQWELNSKEQEELGRLFPRAAGVKEVVIERDYKGTRYVSFIDLPARQFVVSELLSRARKIKPVVESRAEKAPDDATRTAVTNALTAFEAAMGSTVKPGPWGEAVAPAIDKLRQALAAFDAELTPTAETALTELEELAVELPADVKAHQDAINWAVKQLPILVYLDEYPEMPGHQDIAAYLDRKAHNRATVADENFEKLCKVADLDPTQLKKLQDSNDHETRNQLVNRASALVTGDIRRLWKDRALKVRLNLDAQHLDTLISDPNAVYDVEVNLDERSRGFKWFFSFFVTFAADTKGGPTENAVILLDEPGLYLHAASQGDLLKYLSDDLPNQVVFTTHSPFMIPTDNLGAVRTVNIAAESGTTVTNDPTGDSRTLFPLQTALGYKLAQSLFVGPANVVVEGVTDFWFASAASEYLRDKGRVGLPTELVLTPAGGAQKVSYMVTLLTSESLGVLVLLDDEKGARSTSNELVKNKLIHADSVLFATEAFSTSPPSEADIEDFIDPAIYEELVNEAYKNELAGKTLALNAHIPRIVKRYEDSFQQLGLEFNKTRPARLFLQKMASDPDKLMAGVTGDRFEELFKKIAARFEKLKARGFKF
jgi:predicted ATPase